MSLRQTIHIRVAPAVQNCVGENRGERGGAPRDLVRAGTRWLRALLAPLCLAGVAAGLLAPSPALAALTAPVPAPIRAAAASTPAATDRATGSATGSAPGSTSGPGDGSGPSLDELTTRAGQQGAAVTRARAELSRTTAQASAALEAHSLAVQAQQRALAAQTQAEQQLSAAEAELAENRGRLGRWARQAYAAGDGLAADPTLLALLGGSAADLGSTRRILAGMGAGRDKAVAATEAALQKQRQATLSAEQARDAADRAADLAQGTKAAQEAAVQAQRTQLGQLEAALADTQDAVAQAQERARLLAQAQAAALRNSVGTAKGAGSNAVTGEVGDCAGGDTSLYANGQIPAEALCPLWGASGHRLRADAAFAFDRLSAAYAAVFGEPICVTDSYRSYAEQVAVKAAKPNLAATPGTSNHGWGTAVDVCGGVQRFDTEQHRWMSANATAYGWFHPSWAQQNGSKPEPWHWEFGG